MSITQDRRLILCDGIDCRETVLVPIGLRSQLLPAANELPVSEGAERWLYVHKGNRVQHFCPSCNRTRLASLAEEIS